MKKIYFMFSSFLLYIKVGYKMQISISIEPYLAKEEEELRKYIETIIRLSKKMSKSNYQISLHFDYFQYKPNVFKLVQSYADEINIDLHLMKEPADSFHGFRSVSFDAKNILDGEINPQGIPEKKIGLVLDLGYDINAYKSLIEKAKFIIIMTVKCGKSGQLFQESALDLVAKIKQINPKATLIIDGGVNVNNINLVKKSGVDIAVVGSYAKTCYEDNNLEQGINRLLHD